jgi:hypothetical protein
MIEQRMVDMSGDDPFDPDLHGLIAVLEAGDTSEQLTEAIGLDVLSEPWTGVRFGECAFHPAFEVLLEHAGFFELVIVPGDGDYGNVIFIPKLAGVDPELLSFCQAYASDAT